MTDGTLEQIDGYPALRFKRRLPHPVERVWRAVTTYEGLAAWFVTPAEFLRQGQRFEAMGQTGQVLRFESPRIVEWEWGGERFSFELQPDGEGTLLTFVHIFRQRDRGADYASGWHFHLDRLDAYLAGAPIPEARAAQLAALNDRYAENFDLDPEIGRRIIAEHFGADKLTEGA